MTIVDLLARRRVVPVVVVQDPRDAKPLADLPEQERADWQKLWAEVDSLLSKIQ